MSQYEYIVCGPRSDKELRLKMGYHPRFEEILIQKVNLVIEKKKVYLLLNCAVPEDMDVSDPVSFWVTLSLFIPRDRSKVIRAGNLRFLPISYESGDLPAGYKSIGYCSEIKLGFRERRSANLYNVFLEVYGVKLNKTFNKFHVNSIGEFVQV